MNVRVNRVLGRLVGLLGAAAVVLGIGAAVSPAGAAPTASAASAAAAAAVRPAVSFEHIVLDPDRSRSAFVGLRRPGAKVTVHDLVVTVDVAGVARFAQVRPMFDDRCTAAGTVFTCALGTGTIDKGYAALIPFWADATDTAVPGDAGTVTTTVTSREYGAVSRHSTVTVAEPVTFTPGDFLYRTVKPGQRADLSLTVTNTGTRPLTASTMWFYREAMYTYPQSFANCEYGTKRIVCRFADDVPAGATYRLATPFGVTVRKQVPAPVQIGQGFTWATPADARNDLEDFAAEKPKKGTGAALRLVPVSGPAAPPAATPEVPQTTGSSLHSAQHVFFTLSGRNLADLAAVGATARAAVRKPVAVKVGARNLGPAFVFGVSKPAAKVVFARPVGTTVTKVPAGCVPSAKGKPITRKDPRGNPEYLCTTTVNPFEPGQRVLWTFTLRVDRKGKLTGTVRVYPSTTDARKANDSAKLRVN